MTVGEVMVQIDGEITRDFIYYLESKGYINPEKIATPSGKIQRRGYSENDVLKIGLIWEYYKQGFTPGVAYRKALAEAESQQLRLWG